MVPLGRHRRFGQAIGRSHWGNVGAACSLFDVRQPRGYLEATARCRSCLSMTATRRDPLLDPDQAVPARLRGRRAVRSPPIVGHVISRLASFQSSRTVAESAPACFTVFVKASCTMR